MTNSSFRLIRSWRHLWRSVIILSIMGRPTLIFVLKCNYYCRYNTVICRFKCKVQCMSITLLQYYHYQEYFNLQLLGSRTVSGPVSSSRFLFCLNTAGRKLQCMSILHYYSITNSENKMSINLLLLLYCCVKFGRYFASQNQIDSAFIFNRDFKSIWRDRLTLIAHNKKFHFPKLPVPKNCGPGCCSTRSSP